MIALHRSVSLFMISVLAVTSCKSRKDTSSVEGSTAQKTEEETPPEKFFEDQVKELTSQRNLAVRYMQSERETALELEKIGDGAKRIAKISTSFAIVGAAAGGAAAGLVVLGAGGVTVSGVTVSSITVPQAFAATLAYGQGLVVKYGYTKAIGIAVASKAAQGLVSVLARDYLMRSIDGNIKKKIDDEWDELTPKILLTLGKLDTNINEVKTRSQDAAKHDTWFTYVKNSVTFGWYDVSYVRNIQQSHAVLADLYAQKADAYGVLINDLQQRRSKIYGPKK